MDAQERATGLREAAREEMRAARRHRRRARHLMQQLEELQTACAASGVRITINAKPPGAKAQGLDRDA